MMIRPHIFLAYANFSLKEDPENFRRILATITEDLKDPKIQIPAKLKEVDFETPVMDLGESAQSFVEGGADLPEVDRTPRTILEGIAELIIGFGRDQRAAELELGRSRILSLNQRDTEYMALAIGMKDVQWDDGGRIRDFEGAGGIPTQIRSEAEIAFQAAFGYRNGFCMDSEGIPWCKMRTGLFDEAPWLMGENRPLCYECYQGFFRRALALVVKGERFEEIPGFMDFLNSVSRWTNWSYQPGKGKDILERSYRWKYLFDEDRDHTTKGFPYKGMFNDFLWSLAAASFVDFISKGAKESPMETLSLGNLKQCPTCGIFFIAGKKDQSYCSSECYNPQVAKKVRTGRAKGKYIIPETPGKRGRKKK